jgi:hypothetical protein
MKELHKMAQFHRFPFAQTLCVGPGDEFVEQDRIRSLGVLGLAAFMPEMQQEVFYQGLHGEMVGSA